MSCPQTTRFLLWRNNRVFPNKMWQKGRKSDPTMQTNITKNMATYFTVGFLYHEKVG